jgi:E3 ubiquitin-protein ligase RNF103
LLNHHDFTSASEFLESVEDSRGSLWLVHIVTSVNDNEAHQDSSENKYTCENKTKFLHAKTLQKLNSHLSRHGILTGTFDCEKDVDFCKLKGWEKPQLVLGLIKNDLNKEFIELFNYSNCHANKYEQILNWLEQMLRNQLRNKTKNEKSYTNTYLKLFYVQKSLKSKRLPLFYPSLSVKHSRRANFYAISLDKFVDTPKLMKKEEMLFLEVCFENNLKRFEAHMTQSKTPIFILFDNKLCYNYGDNLNESPNYDHLNHFLLFLYPDLNLTFLFSFIFLNSYLILFIFEYDRSSFKQFLRGVFYLCCFNFFLFSIWLFTINTSQSTRVENRNFLENLFSILRNSLMKSEFTQKVCPRLRFFIFFYVYIQPHLAMVIYLFVTVVFYFHTRFVYFKAKKLNKKLIQQKKLQQAQKHLLPPKESNNQTEVSSALLITPRSLNTLPILAIQNVTQREIQATPNVHLTNATNVLPVDLDLEIGVYELINQINGLTTIWLQSSTQADRLLSELPTIEFCKCFYAHTIKIKAMDETDRDTTTEDDEEYSSSKLVHSAATFCDCEKNKELRKYFEEKNFKSKVRRECSICLEKYKIGNLLVLLPCGHLFHKKCVYEWFMNSSNCKCPICRTTHYKFNKNL